MPGKTASRPPLPVEPTIDSRLRLNMEFNRCYATTLKVWNNQEVNVQYPGAPSRYGNSKIKTLKFIGKGFNSKYTYERLLNEYTYEKEYSCKKDKILRIVGEFY